MQTTVSTLLRDFPKFRKAALRGERVVIKTREGELILTANRHQAGKIIGSLKGHITLHPDIDLTLPTVAASEWLP